MKVSKNTPFFYGQPSLGLRHKVHQAHNWKKCLGGAKPAHTITLEGRKPYSDRETKPQSFCTWGTLPVV